MTVFTMDDLYRKMYDLKLLIRNILIKSKRTWDEPRGQIEYDTNDPDINQQYKEFTDMFEAIETIANRIDLLISLSRPQVCFIKTATTVMRTMFKSIRAVWVLRS